MRIKQRMRNCSITIVLILSVSLLLKYFFYSRFSLKSLKIYHHTSFLDQYITKKVILNSENEFDDIDNFQNKAKKVNNKRNKKNAGKQTKKICPGNNTVFINNKCRCENGFKGFPHDERGCFKCSSCYSDEICVYPGRCSCLFGQMRASNGECIWPTIQMLSAYPTSIERDKGGLVSVEVYPKDVSIRPIYCMIGHSVSNAIKGERPGLVLCQVPSTIRRDSFLYVSDSKAQWPSQGLLIHLIRKSRPDFTQESLIASALSIFICTCVVYLTHKFFKSLVLKAIRSRKNFEYIPN